MEYLMGRARAGNSGVTQYTQ